MPLIKAAMGDQTRLESMDLLPGGGPVEHSMTQRLWCRGKHKNNLIRAAVIRKIKFHKTENFQEVYFWKNTDRKRCGKATTQENNGLHRFLFPVIFKLKTCLAQLEMYAYMVRHNRWKLLHMRIRHKFCYIAKLFPRPAGKKLKSAVTKVSQTGSILVRQGPSSHILVETAYYVARENISNYSFVDLWDPRRIHELHSPCNPVKGSTHKTLYN